MEKHAYHTYQILDHVSQTPLVTNRRVASKLDVSVKLAHGLLTQLVKKGLLHIKKRNARRWDYFLTPQGLAEKARLTYQFMDFTMQFYRQARRRSAEVLAGLSKKGVRRIAFLGVTELAEIAFLGVNEHRLELIQVFDDVKAGEEFMGVTIESIAAMASSPAEKILVTAFDPAMPMSQRYLPNGISGSANGKDAVQDKRLVWTFGGELRSQGEEKTDGRTPRTISRRDAEAQRNGNDG